MNGGHGNCYDTLYSNDHATIPGAFHFQENTFLTLEVTTRNTDFGPLDRLSSSG